VKATCSSETPIDFQWTTGRYIPEDRTLPNHRCDNLKSIWRLSSTSWELLTLLPKALITLAPAVTLFTLPSDLGCDYYDFIISWFSQSLHQNVWILPQIRPQPLPSTSFPIHNSLIILPFDAIESEILTASLNKSYINKGSRESSVGIAGLWAGRPGFNSRQGHKFLLYSTVSSPVMEPTHPPIHWVSVAVSPGIKWPGLEADQSPPSSAEVNNSGAIHPFSCISSWRSI
jgi:hypothetical protein